MQHNYLLVFITAFVVLSIAHSVMAESIWYNIDDGTNVDQTQQTGATVAKFYKPCFSFSVNDTGGITISHVDLAIRRFVGSDSADFMLSIENQSGNATASWQGSPIKGCVASVPSFTLNTFAWYNFSMPQCDLQGGATGRMYWACFNTSTASLPAGNNAYYTLRNTTTPKPNAILNVWRSGDDWAESYQEEPNIRFWINKFLTIVSPTNITTVNPIAINISNSSQMDYFWYAINDTFTYFPKYASPNTTVNVPSIGSFNLTAYSNTSTGTTYSDTVFFSTAQYAIHSYYNDTNLLETKYGTWSITLDDASGGVNYYNATLFVNGTALLPTGTVSGSRLNWTYIGIPPYLQGNINDSSYTFWWNISVNNGSGYYNISSISGTQPISRLRVLPCAAPMGNSTVSFSIYDEDSTSSKVLSNFNADFSVWVNGGNRNYSYSNTSSYQSNYCIYPGWAAAWANISAQYSNSSYSTRFYFNFYTPLTNTSTPINLYSLSTVNSTTIVFNILDIYKVPQANLIVKASRYYPGTGQFIQTSTCKTGYDGTCSMPMEMNQYYVYGLFPGGSSITSYPSTQLSTTTLTLYTNPGNFLNVYDYYGSLQYQCSIDNTRFTLTCTLTDITNTMTTGRLIVKRMLPANYSTPVCDQTGTGSSVTLLCNLSAYNTSTLYYYLYGTFYGNQQSLVADYINWAAASGLNFGTTGLILGLLLIIVLFMAGLYNSPGTAMILGLLGFIADTFTGLIVVPWPITFGVVLATAIVIYLVET